MYSILLNKRRKTVIKVLHKAFDLLEIMAENKSKAFTLTELSEMIGEKPSTCANIVKTLCDRGFLSRTEPKGYVLGPVAEGLNYATLADSRLIESSRDAMNALVKKYGASGLLAVLRHGKKKILDNYSGEGDIVINKSVRENYELYTTSTGLVLSALGKTSFSESETEIIEKVHGSVERLLEIRDHIKEYGYVALSVRPQVFEVAAAVYENGERCAAVAVYLPEFLISEDGKDELIKEIRESAKKISERIEK